MIKVTSSIHNHCTHCDGNNSAWEMAESAYLAGFTDFGFSSHSLIECTPAVWAMRDEKAYIDEINAIKKAYEGKMRVYCGLEVDYFSLPRENKGFDYLIDSVHKLYKDGKYFSVDSSRELFE
ncbi:MAG: histidinol phosphate phosphatase, partial [Clostridia bacterium]|nr:histidinol phosphate phosphatase [Clostridia bacterium]